MTEHGGNGVVPKAAAVPQIRYHKKDFWADENLKFGQPWYRLEKSARLITRLARGRERTLLDVGCGPAAMMHLLPPSISYFGIDIAIPEPAENLLEADILQLPIRFGDRSFDFVIAQGVFEYLGEFQEQKFAEIAELLTADGIFFVTYTNFGHRKPQVYWPFSNVRPIGDFRRSLSRYFSVDRSFPGAYNWKHALPNRPLVKAINLHVSTSIPVISRKLAVEYFFICSAR